MMDSRIPTQFDTESSKWWRVSFDLDDNEYYAFCIRMDELQRENGEVTGVYGEESGTHYGPSIEYIKERLPKWMRDKIAVLDMAGEIPCYIETVGQCLTPGIYYIRED